MYRLEFRLFHRHHNNGWVTVKVRDCSAPFHFRSAKEVAEWANKHTGFLWRKRKVVTRYPSHLQTDKGKRSR